MKSTKKIWLLCLVIFSVGIAGVALAKAVKVELEPYDNPAIGIAEPDASGHVILNYAKGADKTEAQVNCWGLMPEAEYTVYLEAPAGWHPIGTFTTDVNGEGNLHAKLPGDHSSHLPAAVNNADNYTVLMSQ